MPTWNGEGKVWHTGVHSTVTYTNIFAQGLGCQEHWDYHTYQHYVSFSQAAIKVCFAQTIHMSLILLNRWYVKQMLDVIFLLFLFHNYSYYRCENSSNALRLTVTASVAHVLFSLIPCLQSGFFGCFCVASCDRNSSFLFCTTRNSSRSTPASLRTFSFDKRLVQLTRIWRLSDHISNVLYRFSPVLNTVHVSTPYSRVEHT